MFDLMENGAILYSMKRKQIALEQSNGHFLNLNRHTGIYTVPYDLHGKTQNVNMYYCTILIL